MEKTTYKLLMCILAAAAMAPAQAQTATESVLHNFASNLPAGWAPWATPIRDSAGNLYGTTIGGGTGGHGVVYKVDTAGHETILHSFTGGTDGGTPYGGVIRDSDGNLYGTAYGGGTAGAGVVYKLNPAGQEAVLYNFTGGADGGFPYAGVIRDSAGNLYGTASSGGSGFLQSGYGVVYKLSAAGQQTVLYTFTGGFDGGSPFAGVIADGAGNLYGTAGYGGTEGKGVVYKLTAAGQESVLYSFTGGADGGYPNSVIRDSSGNLYGTTYGGGNLAGFGVVYELNTAGHQTVLYSFTGGADGGSPESGVIRDASGNLYGTTHGGGASSAGVVYKLAGSQETVLYSFTGAADGSEPIAGVILDSAGNLYGATYGGGVARAGVVYKLDAAGQETVLYGFAGAAGGTSPDALERDSAGNFYGTAFSGGAANAGVVFKLSAAGQETVLYSFTGGADGGEPAGGVIQDSSGNLYGTAVVGGAAGYGVVYKLTAAGQQTVLHSFTAGTDGAYPYAGVVRDSAGNLYGDTSAGGTANAGVIYKVNAAGTETVLYAFTGGADGSEPNPGLIRDSAGNLYGTTYRGGASNAGVVFKVSPAGKETVLYTFTGGADGGQPESGVIRDAAGNFYGTVAQGGSAGWGVVYTLSTTGQETVLYNFTIGFGGGAAVIRDPAGNLYGTIYQDAAAGYGAVYELDAAGSFNVLYNFTGGDDGGQPEGPLSRDSSANLYGTANMGGASGGGVVFKVTPP